VAEGAEDRWLAAAWDPRRPALQLAADTAAAAVPVAPGLPIYVQVGSTANEAWAQESARQLRTAGMQAGVLSPTTIDEPYRVVLGPYPTREAAEAAGRKLGRPFWIFTREGRESPR
jgi:cell division septation protein DedD